MPYSYASALRNALATALAARTQLTDLLGTPPFYDVVASAAGRDRLLQSDGSEVNSYIVFGSPTDNPVNWFNEQKGTSNTEGLHIWTDPYEGTVKARAIWEQMAEVLNDPISMLGGGVVLRGTANLIMIVADDSGLIHGWVEYRAELV